MATGKRHQWGNVYGEGGVAPTQVSTQHKFPTLVQQDTQLNADIKTNRLFNMYGDEYGTGYAGNVYGTDGVAPALEARDHKDPVRIAWDD